MERKWRESGHSPNFQFLISSREGTEGCVVRAGSPPWKRGSGGGRHHVPCRLSIPTCFTYSPISNRERSGCPTQSKISNREKASLSLVESYLKMKMQKTHRPETITKSAERFCGIILKGKGLVENREGLADAWVVTERPDPSPPKPIIIRPPRPSPPMEPPASPSEVSKAVAQFRDAIRPTVKQPSAP